MAANVLVDTGFLVALLSRRDNYHAWATAVLSQYPPPWQTCEAVLSESFHLIGPEGRLQLSRLLHRGALSCRFALDAELETVLRIMEKYAEVPMSLADACLVRMTEQLADPVVITTDTDFHIYRRHGRRTVPAVSPA